MILYDVMKMTQADYDTYDTVFDAVVTVCYIEENEANDNYDKFCIELMKKVEVDRISGMELIVKWTEFIKNNMDKFKAFAMRHWAFEYNDEDEFIYQWIKEIHYYMAGYVSEDFYGTLVEFVATLKS